MTNRFFSLLVAGFTLGTGAFAAPLASGRIVLPANLAGSAKGIRTVFVSVYLPNGKGDGTAKGKGMPYGATKIDLAADPKSGDVTAFDLDTTTIMMMSSQEMLPKKIDIKVKLDKDGSAGPDEAGDIVGWARDVKVGTKNLVVKTDQQVH